MDSAWQVGLLLITVLGLALLGPDLLPGRSCRAPSDLSAAAATLKAGVFPAQVQFQGGSWIDQDGDGTGEYGLLSELSGRRPTGTACRLLQGPLGSGDLAHHYRYAIWLPDGAGGALGEPEGMAARPALAAAAPAQARHFRAYAWPDGTGSNKRMFCIDETGVLRAADWKGAPPGWDAVTGGKGWGAAPVWPQFAR